MMIELFFKIGWFGFESIYFLSNKMLNIEKIKFIKFGSINL